MENKKKTQRGTQEKRCERKGRSKSTILELKKGEEFWDYVRQFEIMSLPETWVEERSWKKIDATERVQMGRSRGKKRKEKGKS
jgi:hypothetical protein